MIPDLLDIPESDEDEEIEQLIGQANCNEHLPPYITYYMVATDQIFGMDECGVLVGDRKPVAEGDVQVLKED